MFSPEASVHGSVSTRNPRRRQRTGSDDSIALRQNPKRRKRSLLAPDTFEAPSVKQANGHTHHSSGKPALNGHPVEERNRRDVSVDTTSLAIRGRGGKRVDREKRSGQKHEGIILTKNDNYEVTQLSTVPEYLQAVIATERWHGNFFSSHGYALALTQTHAIVWRYDVASSGPSKPLIVRLPNPSNNSRHPLPLGSLVYDAGAGELGLLVAMPVSGKVTYWESVSAASNADLVRHKQAGLQGTVTGLMSGENIINITEAEPDGFVLTTSTGRIAHLAVKDHQGRPAMITEYLRGQGATSGGLLGGLKSVFSSAGWRRDIAAIKVVPSKLKAQRHVVIATAQGLFQVWELSRTARTLTFEINAKEELIESIRATSEEAFEQLDESFMVADFVLFPTNGVVGSASGLFRLLVLTIIDDRGFSRYALHDLTIRDGKVNMSVVHPIQCYATHFSRDAQWKPHILLPGSAQTAVILFDTSIVLLSLAEIEDTPSSQLQKESHILPDTFQDTLDFQKNKGYHVVGSCSEVSDQESKTASCAILIHGFGMIRVATLPAKGGQTNLERSAVTAKTKIEQAVFFGDMPHNLLDFSGRPEIQFEKEEVESAALTINDSIMKSTTSYVPAITPSMDHQLKLRSTALAELMKYLMRHQSPLDKLTRWKLLWSAEKMAAARAIWKCHEASIGPQSQARIPLLPELLDMLSERYKVENQPDRGETDIVRHYLIHDIWRIELVVPWAQQVVEELHTEGIQDAVRQASIISQASDIQISALEAAFSFRENNASLYGLGDEVIEDGILQEGYELLPQIWTSLPETVAKTKQLADLSREMVINHQDSADEEDEPELSLLLKMAKDNPRLVHVCCQSYDERCRWLKARSDPQSKADAKALELTFSEVRRTLIVKIAELELPDEGIKLAEKYRDMKALVDILAKSTDVTQERLEQPGISDSEGEELTTRLDANTALTKKYFTTFGNTWADALYSKHIEQGHLADLLQNVEGFQGHLTRYLRSKPMFSKLSWINEVLAERNYAKTADTLSTAQKQESNVWAKKVELSIGKLALLAAKEKQQVQGESVKNMVGKIERRVGIVDIQEMLYQYIRPTLRGAIDELAEADLAKDQFCRAYVTGKPALRNILEQNMSKLVAKTVLDAEELIDTITLMDEDGQHLDEDGFAEHRFWYAFKLLKLVALEDSGAEGRRAMHEKIIWRRCLLQDDWKLINKSELKTDTAIEVETSGTALFKTLKAGFKDGLFDRQAPLSPGEILADGVTPTALRTSSRYAKLSDSAAKALSHDISFEDKALEQMTEQARLNEWWRGVVDAARQSVRDDADRKGAEMARLEELKKAAAEKIKAANGLSNGTRNRSQDVEKDWQGDVAMT